MFIVVCHNFNSLNARTDGVSNNHNHDDDNMLRHSVKNYNSVKQYVLRRPTDGYNQAVVFMGNWNTIYLTVTAVVQLLLSTAASSSGYPCSLEISSRSFRYAKSYLWNQLPASNFVSLI